MNKRILISLSVIGAVATIVIGGTVAYFSDTEASTGNTFTAETLDLKVGDQDDPMVVTVVRNNMQPQTPYTYQGYNQQFVLRNAGSLPGTVSWTIKNVENSENGCNEPETSLFDTTCGTGTDQGELGQYTWIKWFEKGGTHGSFGPFNLFNMVAGVKVTGPVLQPGKILNAYMWLDFPQRLDNMENLAQGDGLKFDIEFKLDQVNL